LPGHLEICRLSPYIWRMSEQIQCDNGVVQTGNATVPAGNSSGRFFT